MNTTIDLNADVGEGAGFDAQLMPLISSANIACGAHAGDHETMRETLLLAQQHGVVVGAHPGYADRANFGRVVMPLTAHEITNLVRWQVQALLDMAHDYKIQVRYVKPHGALYNLAARDHAVADAIVAGIKACNRDLRVMGLAHSALTHAAETAGMKPIHEAFIDRMYEADGTLRARNLPNAVHDDQRMALKQAINLAHGLPIHAYDGSALTMNADSLCIHGDTPHAVAFAQAVNRAFATAQITVAPAYLRR